MIDEAELKRYSKNWHRPAVAKDLDKYDQEDTQSHKIKITVASVIGKAVDRTGN